MRGGLAPPANILFIHFFLGIYSICNSGLECRLMNTFLHLTILHSCNGVYCMRLCSSPLVKILFTSCFTEYEKCSSQDHLKSYKCQDRVANKTLYTSHASKIKILASGWAFTAWVNKRPLLSTSTFWHSWSRTENLTKSCYTLEQCVKVQDVILFLSTLGCTLHDTWHVCLTDVFRIKIYYENIPYSAVLKYVDRSSRKLSKQQTRNENIKKKSLLSHKNSFSLHNTYCIQANIKHN
jgi:hypothetical protein